MTVHDLFNLSGRVALITGATGYLGSAMADALAEAGASVVVSSRRLGDAQDVAARLVRGGDAKHHAIEMDHTDERSIQRGFDAALAAAGRVDVLVNNGHDPTGADWRTVTAEQFTRQLANATGYFLLSRLMHDYVVARRDDGSGDIDVRGGGEEGGDGGSSGGGSIVLLGSMYGTVGSYPDAYDGVAAASPVAYHALKGGIVQMTRHLAVYWAKDGVRVNCLSPGPFPSAKAAPAMVERLVARSPMGRMGRPDELKGAVVFLASAASSYMTGQNLIIDGGWTAW